MNVLNVGVVAHVDHGKSTFTAALISKLWGRSFSIEDLDNLTVERNRGITVRAQIVRLYKDEHCRVNLIDTPGHADFQGEVMKTLASYNLVLILISAKDGIQSQTINRYRQVVESGKKIAWVINKIDTVEEAQLEEVEISILSLCQSGDVGKVFKCSAKTGVGLDQVVNYILEVAHSEELVPEINSIDHLKVLSLVGKGSEGTHLLTHYLGKFRPVSDLFLGQKEKIKLRKVLSPMPESIEVYDFTHNDMYHTFVRLSEGHEVSSGDMLTFNKLDAAHLEQSNFQNMMYECLVVSKEEDYTDLESYLLNLARDDAWLSVIPTVSPFFGRSFKCQSAGLLHLEVVIDRVKDELGVEVVKVMSLPILKLIERGGKVHYTNSLDGLDFKAIIESYVSEVTLRLETSLDLVHTIIDELRDVATLAEEELLGQQAKLTIHLHSFDLNEKRLSNFYSKTRGQVTVEQVGSRWVKCGIRLVDIWINQTLAQSIIIPLQTLQSTLKGLLEEISHGVNRSIFEIILRAKSGQKVLASHRIRAYKEDKTVGLYGGDESRKKKVRERQKRGKSRLQAVSTVNFNVKTYLSNKLRKVK